jgi:hypothetical protein
VLSDGHSDQYTGHCHKYADKDAHAHEYSNQYEHFNGHADRYKHAVLFADIKLDSNSITDVIKHLYPYSYHDRYAYAYGDAHGHAERDAVIDPYRHGHAHEHNRDIAHIHAYSNADGLYTR